MFRTASRWRFLPAAIRRRGGKFRITLDGERSGGRMGVSAVTYYENGFPLNITQNNQNGLIGAAVQRPNINPGVSGGTRAACTAG